MPHGSYAPAGREKGEEDTGMGERTKVRNRGLHKRGGETKMEERGWEGKKRG